MRSPKSNRGSVLVAALILSAIIAISLSSYLALTITAYRLSQRSFFSNGAMNLVDTGFEQALWSQDYSNWTGAGFNQRSGYTTQWQGTFPSATTFYQFKQGVKGQVKVWLDTTNMPAHAVSKAIITMGDGTTLIKQAEIYLQKKSYFTNGLVAKNQITFSGNNAMVDSWNSDPDNNPATAAVPYSSSVAHDNGSVGSLSVNVDSISVSNADIYGYAAIGGSSLTGISVGPNGLVGPYGTANGTIDTSHVTYDFTTSFPDATAPAATYSLGTINTNGSAVTLPRAGDVPNSDGTYYYSVPSISLGGNGGSLVISGSLVGVSHPNVVVVVTNTNGTVVSSTGQSGINIDTGASLSMYTSGNVSLAGNVYTAEYQHLRQWHSQRHRLCSQRQHLDDGRRQQRDHPWRHGRQQHLGHGQQHLPLRRVPRQSEQQQHLGRHQVAGTGLRVRPRHVQRPAQLLSGDLGLGAVSRILCPRLAPG